MSPALGFIAMFGGSSAERAAASGALQNALAHFERLDLTELILGQTHLWFWGRGALTPALHYLPDGSLIALVGSPAGSVSWPLVQDRLLAAAEPGDFHLPWDGRVILMKVDPRGDVWTLWNDWLGSIPVFHASSAGLRIASTLEPAVVAALGCTPDDVFLPGLLSLLIHGNCLSDWTLFRNMKVLPPDSASEWSAGGFRGKQYFTVRPTEGRWEEGWDELVEEMHELSRRAIADVLRTQSTWILPLSGGLDSRLIAAVGAELGVNVLAYTWGAQGSLDTIYGRQLARALDLPWTWIDLGREYLTRYVGPWLDVFGSAMHAHGMYQMAFFDALRSEPAAPVASGFLGETLAGYDVRFQTLLHSLSQRSYQIHPDGYLHWLPTEVRALFKRNVDDAFDQLAAEIEKQSNAVPGPWFQRLRFLTLWGRQRHFTSFSSTLADHYRGVCTPFLDRTYARFCLSLPRVALEERRLQADLFRRHYRSIATIPVAPTNELLVTNGTHILRRRIARHLPTRALRGPFRDFNPAPLSRDGECMRAAGQAALWPIYDVWHSLGEWFNMDQIVSACERAIAGEHESIRKVQAIQALAYRLRR